MNILKLQKLLGLVAIVCTVFSIVSGLMRRFNEISAFLFFLFFSILLFHDFSHSLSYLHEVIIVWLLYCFCLGCLIKFIRPWAFHRVEEIFALIPWWADWVCNIKARWWGQEVSHSFVIIWGEGMVIMDNFLSFLHFILVTTFFTTARPLAFTLLHSC